MVSPTGVAENGALDPGLAIIIDSWPVIAQSSRSIIVSMARNAAKAANSPPG